MDFSVVGGGDKGGKGTGTGETKNSKEEFGVPHVGDVWKGS